MPAKITAQQGRRLVTDLGLIELHLHVTLVLPVKYFIVVKSSHLLDHTNHKWKRQLMMGYTLLCFVYCDVVLIYYSDVLNKVSCYTVLVE